MSKRRHNTAHRLRRCGECTACCVAFRSDVLGKAANEPCRHLRSFDGTGSCAAYANRPDECRHFNCLWRVGREIVKGTLRPDRLGVLFVGNRDGSVLQCHELKPGAVSDKAVQTVIHLAIKSDVPVVVTTLNGEKKLHVPANHRRTADEILEAERQVLKV